MLCQLIGIYRDFWRGPKNADRRANRCRRIVENCIRVEGHGNVLTAIGFLHGLSTRDLRQTELDYRDDDFQVLITIRAVKPERTT